MSMVWTKKLVDKRSHDGGPVKIDDGLELVLDFTDGRLQGPLNVRVDARFRYLDAEPKGGEIQNSGDHVAVYISHRAEDSAGNATGDWTDHAEARAYFGPRRVPVDLSTVLHLSGGPGANIHRITVRWAVAGAGIVAALNRGTTDDGEAVLTAAVL